jgi:hypothetical protein
LPTHTACGATRQPWQTSFTHEPSVQPNAQMKVCEGYWQVPAAQVPGARYAVRSLAELHAAAGGASQPSHATPPRPHCEPLCWLGRRQAPEAVQQPFAQLVASHTHWPLTQRWPTLQLGPVPQRQSPVSVQVSEPTPHEVHAVPFAPQVVALRGEHDEPLQQPVAQVCRQPLHAPSTHDSP